MNLLSEKQGKVQSENEENGSCTFNRTQSNHPNIIGKVKGVAETEPARLEKGQHSVCLLSRKGENDERSKMIMTLCCTQATGLQVNRWKMSIGKNEMMISTGTDHYPPKKSKRK